MKTNQLFALYRLFWGEGASALLIDSRGRTALSGGKNGEHRIYVSPFGEVCCNSLDGRSPQLSGGLSARRTARRLLHGFMNDNRSEMYLLGRTFRPWGAALGEKMESDLFDICVEWGATSPSLPRPWSGEELHLATLSLLADRMAARPYSLTEISIWKRDGLWCRMHSPLIDEMRIGWSGTVRVKRHGENDFVTFAPPEGQVGRMLALFMKENRAWIENFVEGREECL